MNTEKAPPELKEETPLSLLLFIQTVANKGCERIDASEGNVCGFYHGDWTEFCLPCQAECFLSDDQQSLRTDRASSPAAEAKCIHCDPAFVPTGPDDWCNCHCHLSELSEFPTTTATAAREAAREIVADAQHVIEGSDDEGKRLVIASIIAKHCGVQPVAAGGEAILALKKEVLDRADHYARMKVAKPDEEEWYRARMTEAEEIAQLITAALEAIEVKGEK